MVAVQTTSESDLLERIRQAELASSARIEEARKEAERIIADARTQANSIIQEAETKARRERESIVSAGKAGIDAELQRIRSDSEAQVSELNAKASRTPDLKKLISEVLQL